MEKLYKEVGELIDKIKSSNALIHCITHGINLNDMANVILALNQSPIMVDHEDEVERVTKNASSLLINLGNFKEHRRSSMKKSLAIAKENNIPVVMDMVGIGVSNLRFNLAKEFLDFGGIKIIKGNYSEIMALENSHISTRGVDNEEKDYTVVERCAKEISKKYNVTVIATGKIDIIVNMKSKIKVLNGDSMLTKVTGTGCMTGAMAACFIAHSNDSFISSLTAMTIMGTAGKRAADISKGPGSFHINLIDEIYNSNSKNTIGSAQWEI